MNDDIIAVTGGRDYADSKSLVLVLNAVHQMCGFRILVHGCATGADTLAASWAMSRGIHPAGVPALWDFYGPKTAGGIRNGAMLWLKPQRLVAFPGGRGTLSMIEQAQAAGVPVIKAADILALIGAA